MQIKNNKNNRKIIQIIKIIKNYKNNIKIIGIQIKCLNQNDNKTIECQ